MFGRFTITSDNYHVSHNTLYLRFVDESGPGTLLDAMTGIAEQCVSTLLLLRALGQPRASRGGRPR